MHDAPEQRIFPFFLALLCLAPLGLGGARPLPAALIASGVALLLVFWAGLMLFSGRSMMVGLRRLSWVLLPASLVILWTTIQALWPTSLAWAAPQWAISDTLLGKPSGPAVISLTPWDSLSGVMLALSYLGTFWLAANCGRDPARAQRFFRVLTYAGLIYAAYGLLMLLGGFDMILWWDRWAYQDSVTSSFVNRNHYATYAGLGLICGLGLLLQATRRLGSYPLRERIPLLIEEHWSLLLAVSVIFLALVLTGSRAGLIAVLLGVTTLVAVSLRRQALSTAQIWIMASGVLLAFTLLFSLVGDTTMQRFLSSATTGADRQGAWSVGLQALSTAPLNGFGLGGFADAFALHRDERVPGLEIWQYAHNDYLHAAMELGIPATVLIVLAIAYPVWACVRGSLTRHRHSHLPAIGLGASVLVASHAFFDFSLHMPAVAISYAAILGIAYSQSWSSRES